MTFTEIRRTPTTHMSSMTSRSTDHALFYRFTCARPTHWNTCLPCMIPPLSRLHGTPVDPLMGTTAYQDRMGDEHPRSRDQRSDRPGISGFRPLDAVAVTEVDRTLADPQWRALFHTGFEKIDASSAVSSTSPMPCNPAERWFQVQPRYSGLLEPQRATQHCTVAVVQALAKPRLTLDEAYVFEVWPGLAQDRRGPGLYDSPGPCPQAGPRHRFYNPLRLVQADAGRDGIDLPNEYLHR